MKNRFLGFFFMIGIYSLVIAGVAWIVQNHSAAIGDVWEQLTAWKIGSMIIMQVGIIFFLSYPAFYIIRVAGYEVSFKHIIPLSYVGITLNHFIPYRPGFALRWYFLQRIYHIELKTFVCTMAIYFMWLFIIAVAALLFASFHLEVIVQSKYFRSGAEWIPALVFFGFGGLFFVRNRLSLSDFRFFQILAKLFCEWKNLLPFLVLTMILYYALVVSISHHFAIIGIHLGLYECLFFISCVQLSNIVHVTPGNMGIIESLLGAVTYWMHDDFAMGFTVVTLFRLSQVSAGILVSLPSIYYLYRCHQRLKHTPH